MLTLPRIVSRPEQFYAGIRGTVPMGDIQDFIGTSYMRIGEWLAANGLSPNGPAFLRYNVIDMAAKLELEWCEPLSAPVQSDADIIAGSLPEGRYAITSYTGPYEDLYDVNAVLIGWARERQIDWDMVETPQGDRFAGRAEIYRSHLGIEDDPAKWVTDVLIKVRD